MNLKHLILTRFNIPSRGRELSLRSQTGWLAGRFELFKTYCLPSVAGQTEQDFEWLIFFDVETPAAFRDEIKRLQSVYAFRAEYTGLSEMPEIVASVLPDYASHAWLLTTRFDSDDILAKDFVARLRAELRTEESCVVNFAEGAILSVLGDDRRVYRIRDVKNPFASFLSPMAPDAKTIWHEMHVHISRLAPVRQVAGRPAWLQVVHGGNVDNRVKGLRVRRNALADIFPILAAENAGREESELRIALENVVLTPGRQAHGLVRYVNARLRGL